MPALGFESLGKSLGEWAQGLGRGMAAGEDGTPGAASPASPPLLKTAAESAQKLTFSAYPVLYSRKEFVTAWSKHRAATETQQKAKEQLLEIRSLGSLLIPQKSRPDLGATPLWPQHVSMSGEGSAPGRKGCLPPSPFSPGLSVSPSPGQ